MTEEMQKFEENVAAIGDTIESLRAENQHYRDALQLISEKGHWCATSLAEVASEALSKVQP